MITNFDFSNNQTYMVEVETIHPKVGTTWDVCEINNESDLQELNEMISGYQSAGIFVGYEIL